MTCDGCKYAEWYFREDAKELKQGECTYEPLVVLSAVQRVEGLMIHRGLALRNGCAVREGYEAVEKEEAKCKA